MSTYDERDSLFSRMELREGSKNYNDYYQRHPERKALDDAARKQLQSQNFSDDVLRRLSIDATFSLLECFRPLARAEKASTQQKIEAAEATEFLSTLATSYGAVMTGIAPLGETCFYEVHGRGAEYGQKVNTAGNTGIVFAVKMSPDEIQHAPSPRESAEVVNAYTRTALIGLVLAHTIRAWGWNASCTMDGRADLVLPVAARYAGLGAIGRSGLLLTDDYGPCVRLGAVVTDLPLKRSKRYPSKAAALCLNCKRCADACPAKAIDASFPEKGNFEAVNDDACFQQWLKNGTDCGLCLSNCPLSRIAQTDSQS